MADDVLDAVVRHVAALPGRPLLVGLAGAVSVGKTTLAGHLQERLGALTEARHVDVVGADGFLFPNAELERRRLLHRKGFPETYDVAAIEAFADALRAGTPARVPVYSHEVFDIVGDRGVAGDDIVIIEGVNTLQPEVARLLDLAIFLEAAESDVVRWYVDRFVQLTEEARRDPSSFYRRFADLDDESLVATARWVWDDINAPNFREHIAPTRVHADLVVRKGADHRVVALEVVGRAR